MIHRKVIYSVPVLNRKPEYPFKSQPMPFLDQSRARENRVVSHSSLLFDCVLQEGTTKLIYAFHPDDPSSENNIPQHDMRSMGARSVFLLNTVENVTKLPNGSKSFDFVMNKVTALAFAEN